MIINQTNKNAYNKNSKKVEVSDVQEVDLGTNVSTVFGGVKGAMNSGLSSRALLEVSPQLSVSHLNNKFGTFDLNIDYPIYYRFPKFTGYFSSENTISKFGMDFTYSFPFISNYSRKEMYISASDKNDEKYIILTKTGIVSKYNFRLSYQSNYIKILGNNFYSLAKNSGYTSVQYFNEINVAEISQKSYSINFGLSYQKLLNTKFNAVDKDNKSYRAFLASYLTFYFDVSYLINSKSEFNDISFYGDDINGVYNNYHIIEKPENYIDLRKLGFRIGVESNYSANEEKNSISSTVIEFGSMPGYFSKFKQSFYFSYTLKLGLIKWH